MHVVRYLFFSFTLLCTMPAFGSSASSQALTQAPALERKAALPKILWEVLDPLPRELLQIIISYDWAPIKGEIYKKLIGHTQAVNSLAMLDETNELISGAEDGTILVWDAYTGALKKRIKAHDLGVKSITLVSRHMLASSAWDETIKFWYTPTWECQRMLEKESKGSSPLCAEPLGTLFFENYQGMLTYWPIKTDKCQTIQRADNTDPIRTFIRLPNNKLATATLKLIEVWDCESKKRTHTIEAHGKTLSAPTFIPPNYLAAGNFQSQDGSLTFWDLNSGKTIQTRSEHTNAVTCLAPLGDGRLASACHDGIIKFWDIRNLEAASCTQTITPPESEQSSSQQPTPLLAQPRPLSLLIEPTRSLPRITVLLLLSNGYLAVGDETGRIMLLS